MSARFTASNEVAIVGYAQSPVQRHAAQPLGCVAVDTATRAIADAGLDVAQIDGFTTGALFPTAGAHTIQDGVSIVSSNWLAEHLGVNPRYASGFQGYGQIPGAVALAVNAVATGAADYVLMHRALHNPAGSYHGNPMREARGSAQWTVPQGYFGPLAMIALPYQEYLQRYDATREAMASVLVEARKNGARIPWSYWYEKPLTAEEYLAAPTLDDPICKYDCDIPVDGVAAFVFTSAERAKDLPHPPVYVSGYATGHPTTRRVQTHWPLDDIMTAGFETARRLWEQTGFAARRRRPARRCTTASRPSCTSGSRCSASAPRVRPTSSWPTAGSTATRPAVFPSSRGRRARQRAHARDPPDARVLPPALGPGRRPPARAGDRRHRVPPLTPLRGAVAYCAHPS